MKYDLHMHTYYSKCSNLKPKIILRLAKNSKLDGIAITDHQEIKGALEVKRLNKDKNFEVIVGEEIGTNYGDVLIYYLKKKIFETDFSKVVEEARKQNALVILPHPFRRTLAYNHKFRVPIAKVKNKIDAIECLNARMLFNSDNIKADKVATKLKTAKTAGSDAHFSFEIGTAFTIFEGNLRTALKKKQTKIYGNTLMGPIGGLMSFIRKKIY